MRRFPIVLVAFAVLTLAVLALGSCGIYQIVTLNAPEAGIVEAGRFTFFATTANNEDAFRGFELYYKLYPSDASPSSDSGWTSLAELQARGFRRVNAISDRPSSAAKKPLISIPPAVRAQLSAATIPSIEFEIDFDLVLSELDPVVRDIDPVVVPQVTLRRGPGVPSTDLVNEPGLFQPFTRYTEADPDISGQPAIWDSIANGSARVAIYVMSYGKDEFFSDAYSVPVFLGLALFSVLDPS